MNVYLFCVAVIVAIAGLALFCNGEKMIPPERDENKTLRIAIIFIGAIMFAIGVAIIVHGNSIPI